MCRLARAALAVATAVACVCTAACTTVPPVEAATAATGADVAAPTPVTVTYRPPVDAPVIDTFRPPSTAYGPGNRGIDYATTPGTPVGAAAGGLVVFAGRVGAGLHAVVLHGDDIRTSSSFLASVAVHRGQRVVAGETVGTTGPTLHFGARAGDAYLDPMVLFDGAGAAGPVVVRLVPDAQRAMGSVADEHSGLRRFLGGVPGAVVGVGAAAVGWARDGAVAVGAGAVASVEELQARVAATVPLSPVVWVRVASGLAAWWDRRDECTPAGVVPPPPPGRRRVVLVAGLGSTSERAGIDDVATNTLGYAPPDVVRFSYRGGTTATATYTAADTQGAIEDSGRRLRALIEDLLVADPGVPVDVIAHSQGGLVASAALGPRAPPGVENLITVATPHQGADLATALDLMARTPLGAAVQEVASHARTSGIDPTSTSVRQLSETSGYLRALNAQPLPAGVRVTSIAARADAVVPSPHARLPGATNVVVSVDGWSEHSIVPAAPAATREMSLALAGMAPTCEGLGDAVLDVTAGETITAAEDALGLLLFGLAR